MLGNGSLKTKHDQTKMVQAYQSITTDQRNITCQLLIQWIWKIFMP